MVEADVCFLLLVMLVGLLRYAHVIEHYGSSLLNTLGLASGWICAAGLIMVGNFQVKQRSASLERLKGIGAVYTYAYMYDSVNKCCVAGSLLTEDWLTVQMFLVKLS